MEWNEIIRKTKQIKTEIDFGNSANANALTRYFHGMRWLLRKPPSNFKSDIFGSDDDDDDNGDDDGDGDDCIPQAAVDNFLLFPLLLQPNGTIFPRCRKLQLISGDGSAKSVALKTLRRPRHRYRQRQSTERVPHTRRSHFRNFKIS